MALYRLERIQQLPISIEKAWAFFSSPKNLTAITPPKMGFEITTDLADLDSMYAGQIIGYVVRPVLGIPLEWISEIKHVEPGRFFVDDQRFGPYSMWFHQHFFREIPGGVEMRDAVFYRLPLGWLGRLAHFLFVKKMLAGIFDYRFQKLESHFGKMK